MSFTIGLSIGVTNHIVCPELRVQGIYIMGYILCTGTISLFVTHRLNEKTNSRIGLNSDFYGSRSSLCFHNCSFQSQARFLVLFKILKENKLDQGSHHVRVLPSHFSSIYDFSRVVWFQFALLTKGFNCGILDSYSGSFPQRFFPFDLDYLTK